MIEPVTFYIAVCDRCGHKDDEGDYAAWAEPDQAHDVAVDSEWHEVGEEIGAARLLCPECVLWSDEADGWVEKPAEVVA